MNKKVGGVLFSVLFAFILVGLVSAQSTESNGITSLINSFVTGIVDILKPFLQVILGTNVPTTLAEFNTSDVSANSFVFLSKLILLLIILSIAYLSLSQVTIINANQVVLWVVSVGVSILAVRTFTPGMLEAVLLPHTAFGLAIASGIPFVLYFFVVEKGMVNHKTLRSIAWIFFAVIFLAIYNTKPTIGEDNFYWIYPAVALLSIVMIFMDGTIQKWFSQMKTDRIMGKSKRERTRIALREWKQIEADLLAGIVNKREANDLVSDLNSTHSVSLGKFR